ncbi:peptidyl-prolyl cis-trans isomerase [Chitinispirillum alkaliphilum]|nr:peptidyl-prolyl cis-trans isomerase [Chitinispirillum alkaliphilum]
MAHQHHDKCGLSCHESTVNSENTQRIFHIPSADRESRTNPYYLDAGEIFRSDAPSISEIPLLHPSAVSVPFTLSSTLNRTLLYGNSAPIDKIRTRSGFLSRTEEFNIPTHISNTRTVEIYPGPGSALTTTNHPSGLQKPEMVAFWENGVFDENILNLRFSRPLSHNLMFSMFSDYRSFKGKRFNHEYNNIIDFYRNFTRDTSTLMNRGYNPETNEHILGTHLHYSDSPDRVFSASILYGDLTNEIALNKTALSSDRLHWGTLNRYIYDIESGFSMKNAGPFTLDLGVRTDRTSARFLVPHDTIGTRLEIAKTHNSEGLLQLGLPISESSSAGLHYAIHRKNDEFSERKDNLSLKNRPELHYKHSLSAWDLRGDLKASAGYTFLHTREDLLYTPVLGVSLDIEFWEQSLHIYANRDAIPVYPGLSGLEIDNPYIDNFGQFGGELFLSKDNMGITLGYQHVRGIEDFTVRNSWLQNTPPYAQSANVILIAPKLKSNNFSLSTRALISDTKPHVKASGTASFIFNPEQTSAFFESKLSFDYWSKQESVTFAGLDVWSSPIYNLNLSLSAHIQTFRLFYKVDNLLNRKHAWVPGYFSPGVTFRWGINWYLQS